ncbi:MAG: GNAT family N-acetyltransferase, partial [Deltaproteobacteria bacterium]
MQQRLGADIDGYLARTAHFAAALAASEGEVEEAQRLRYRVFADEFGARIPGSAQGLDRDDLDAFCHHLLVRERQSRMLVG